VSESIETSSESVYFAEALQPVAGLGQQRLNITDVRDRRGRRDAVTGSVVSSISMSASSPGMVTSLLPRVSRLRTNGGSGRQI
jgi:hypothetical protein